MDAVLLLFAHDRPLAEPTTGTGNTGATAHIKGIAVPGTMNLTGFVYASVQRTCLMWTQSRINHPSIRKAIDLKTAPGQSQSKRQVIFVGKRHRHLLLSINAVDTQIKRTLPLRHHPDVLIVEGFIRPGISQPHFVPRLRNNTWNKKVDDQVQFTRTGFEYVGPDLLPFAAGQI